MGNEPAGVKLLRDLSQTGPAVVLKWFLVAGLFIYMLFALVVVKQAAVMAETFESEVNSSVKTFAWIHLIFTVFLMIAAAVIL
jgi:hypothetical protein